MIRKDSEIYRAIRKTAIKNGCTRLTEDERARRTVNIDTET